MKTIFLSIITLLFFNLSSAQDEIKQDWMSYYQYCDVQKLVGKKFRVTAVIKKLNGDANSKAAIWVRIDDGSDGYTFFENKFAENKITDTWQLFKTEGVIEKSSEILNFGAFCKMNGAFYFDDFKVQYLDKSNAWKDIDISNPSFENDEDSFVPAWNHGISPSIEKVKGYTVNYTDKSSFEGKKSLLIEGKGILLDMD